ncbi:MAG: ATP:cob(I)alamin adenosyltransferase [Sphingobacteriales bacterium]|nr:MAG: ATP:cob(I)alamin adenosyltransferase [Sphingobacteriales bacterium]
MGGRLVSINCRSEEANVPELVIPYLNRLSDFLFTLCRYLTHQANGGETPWRARM